MPTEHVYSLPHVSQINKVTRLVIRLVGKIVQKLVSRETGKTVLDPNLAWNTENVVRKIRTILFLNYLQYGLEPCQETPKVKERVLSSLCYEKC